MRKHPAAPSLLLLAFLLLVLLPGSTGISLGQMSQATHPRSTQTVGTTTRVSVASDGVEGNGNSYDSCFSADGRYVAFGSAAGNLVTGDTNSREDIFVHDRQMGQTQRVSVASDGAQGNSSSYRTYLSANGRYVAFESYASNLVAGDTNGFVDIFVHDRQTGQTERVSVSTDGTEGDGSSFDPSLSADGRYVGFYSKASNLVADDTNGYWDSFVYDRHTGETERVSVASDGMEGNGDSYDLSFSADGRYVAFSSDASNLVVGDTNGTEDVFVHDRQTGQTTRVSVASYGTQGNNDSRYPSLSTDGRYVSFMSYSSNLVAGDSNSSGDIFLRDQQTSRTELVSVNSYGTQGNGDSWYTSLSADGRYVAFSSDASNLVTGDSNVRWDTFVHDRQTGQTSRVSVGPNETEGDGMSLDPTLSADGRYVAFESYASNLVAGDTNSSGDVFVHDRGTAEPTYTISGQVIGTDSLGISDVTVSASGSRWTVTDPDGAYDITDLPTGSYTLTPYKSGYTFSPASRIVTVPPDATGQDFVGLSVSELVYDGPLFLPWSAVLDEVDSRISMGDHVHLRLPFRNSTAQTMYNVQVEFSGALPMVGRPGVHVYNGTDWTSNALITLTPSDIPPGVTAHADFWIYVDNVEPEFRESLSGQTLMKAYYRDAQWVIPILLSPVSFDIDGNEDMTAWSCLHHPENFEIERYAQYAAGAPSMSTPPAIEGDPDTATQALRNLAAAVYREFPRAETGELRMPDFTLLERRGQIVGNCRHVADLTTGLARSLGLPTRYVMGLFSHPQPEKSGAHAWTEVYLPEYPDRDGWRQADAACDAVLLEGWYEDPDVGYTVERTLADKYPLSSACMFAGLGCRCVHSCYEAPINCPECLSYYWYSPTPWDIFCVENVKDDYHNLTPSRLQDLTEDDDALLVQAEATVFVTRTVPFGVSASIRNNTAATLNAVTASVSLSDTVLSTTQLFEPDPLYHTVPAIAPGETVDLTWEVTPLVAGSGLPLRVFALSDGLLGFDELPLVVGEPGSLPPLMVGGTCNTDQVSPGQSLTLTAYVLDESLQTLDNPPAEVSATVFFSPTTDFSETIAMVFDSVLQQYRGTLDLPIDAPAGRYDVDVRATCPGYSSAESQSAFWAAPPLEIGIDLSTDAIRPQETLTVTVTVQDRGELVAGAGVSADILLPGSSVRIPLLPAGEGVYVAAFRPADLSSELGGVWAIEATADYKGGSATAATSVLVLREIYLPLVLRNH